MLRPILAAVLRGSRPVPPVLCDAPAPPPAGGSPIDEAGADAAVASIDSYIAAASDRFGLLAGSLDTAVERGRRDLAAIEAIEAVPRPHGRGHGLEWAYGQKLVDTDRLRQVAALLRALAPHEAAVRALLTDAEPRQ